MLESLHAAGAAVLCPVDIEAVHTNLHMELSEACDAAFKAACAQFIERGCVSQSRTELQ